MATTRQNQIGWQQFSHRFLGKQEHEDNDDNNDRNDTFEAVQSRPKPKQPRQLRKHVQFVQTEKAPETTAPAAPAHEEVHKAKTRAQKRAIEDDDAIPIEPEAAASKHKERRSDYWVHHDDIRMNRARVWKMNAQQHDE